MVVDDDDVIRSLMTVLLSVAGFETREASSGREAAETVQAFEPHVVTLDAVMPDLTGWEVALCLRADPRTAGIKILLMTARDTDPALLRFAMVRVDACLEKPFDPDTLVAMVKELAEAPPRETACDGH